MGLLLAAILNSTPIPSSGAALPSDIQVKAAMVYNMAKFVDWPSDAFSGENAPFTLCVMGKGPLGTATEALKGKTVKNRKLVIKAIEQVDEANGCQILVIGDSARRQVPVALDRLRKQSILTISDLPKFAVNGGAVGFVDQDGKVRFEINLETAQNARVKISSQLLKLAKIVREGDL
jgi:hypothetical protein